MCLCLKSMRSTSVDSVVAYLISLGSLQSNGVGPLRPFQWRFYVSSSGDGSWQVVRYGETRVVIYLLLIV